MSPCQIQSLLDYVRDQCASRVTLNLLQSAKISINHSVGVKGVRISETGHGLSSPYLKSSVHVNVPPVLIVY